MSGPRASEPSADRALRDEIAAIKWFHTIDLGNGLTTPGLDPTGDRLDILQIPESPAGRTVLDVGAWDGFFSFEAERRGAKRVVASDSFAWNSDNWSNKDGFELARRTLGSRSRMSRLTSWTCRPNGLASSTWSSSSASSTTSVIPCSRSSGSQA